MGTKVLAAVALISAIAVSPAVAGEPPPVTIVHRNSTATIDLSSAGLGMNSWAINGVNQLSEQSFWYQVGSEPVQRINHLSLLDYSVSPNQLTATYQDPRFEIDVDWLLRGSRPGFYEADIAEMISITNTSTAPLPFRFFQFVDMNLLNTPHDTSVSISGGNTAIQSEGLLAVSETAVVTGPTRYEAGYAAEVHQHLLSGMLINNAGQQDGDLAWAFQWDRNILPGATVLISKNKHMEVVPEPSVLALLGAAGAGLLVFAWRRQRMA